MKKVYNVSAGCPVLDYEVNLEVDGTYYGCCHATDYSFDTIKELTNWKEEQKRIMLTGEWPEACNICKTRENAAGASLRTFMLEQHYPDYRAKKAKSEIKQAQISLKNLCNYACIICTPTSSSGIYDLSQKIKKVPSNWQSSNTKWVDSKAKLDEFEEYTSKIEKLTLLGGEPFMIKEYIPFLKNLHKNVEILIVTNASLYNNEMVNELKKFKKVNFCYSVDGYGEVNNAVRLNSNWNDVEKNMLRLQKEFPFPNSNHNLTPTWSNFTIWHFKKLQDWAIKNNMWYGAEAFCQNVIQSPEHLKLQYLSKNAKETILKSLRKRKMDKYFLKYFYQPWEMPMKELDEQYKMLRNIAALKNIDYNKIFPHIYQDIK